MDTSVKRFVDVVVFAKIFGAQKHTLYTYTWDQEIHRGDLVEVPFRKKIVSGIVFHISRKASEKRVFRPIRAILKKQALTQKQIHLARFFWQEYRTPPEKVFRLFLSPKEPKTAEKEKKPLSNLKPLILPQRYQNALTSLSHPQKKHKHVLLLDSQSESRLLLIFSLFLKSTRSNRQHLMLFPDKASLFHAQTLIQTFFEPASYRIVHGSLTPRQKFFTFTSIREGKTRFIFGTKGALFCPFQKLEHIVLEDEYRPSHKQRESTPHYDSRRIVRELADIHRARLIFTGATSSTTALFLAQEESWCREEMETTFLPNWNIVYPTKYLEKKERMKKKMRPFGSISFSKELKNAIQRTLEKKRTFFLLVSRRGMGSLNVCRNCKHILSCPKCDRALIAQINGTYHCRHCHFTSDIFLSCPICSGMEFVRKIEGTQTVEKLVRQYFPHASTIRIDSDTLKSAKENALFSKKDIIIGTPTVLYRFFGKKFGGSGIVDADSFWKWPDYLAEEHAFHLFSSLAHKSYFTVLQTYQPHHRVVQALLSKETQVAFERDLLDERKLLGYPPFSRRITLMGKHADKNFLQKQVDYIQNMFSSLSLPCIQFGIPFVPIRKKDRLFHFLAITIKWRKPWTEPIDASIISLLQSLPNNWIVDIDSEEIV